MKIAVDFDRTIYDCADGETMTVTRGPVRDSFGRSSIEWLRYVLDAGIGVTVFTARHPSTHAMIADWIELQGLPRLLVTNIKPDADLFIDDKGYRFEGEFPSIERMTSSKVMQGIYEGKS